MSSKSGQSGENGPGIEQRAGETEPVLHKRRSVQIRRNSPYLNLTKESQQIVGISSQTDMDVFLFNGGIWLQPVRGGQDE